MYVLLLDMLDVLANICFKIAIIFNKKKTPILILVNVIKHSKLVNFIHHDIFKYNNYCVAQYFKQI